MEWYKAIYVRDGAVITNPGSIVPLLEHLRSKDENLLGNKGPLAFGYRLPVGIVVAFNHKLPVDDPLSDLHSVGPHTFVSITGGMATKCHKLMQDLRAKCMRYGNGGVPGASVNQAVDSMTEILRNRREVGLIAGWDDTKVCTDESRLTELKTNEMK
ncbi:OLC1v1024252C1 [Oldenlandia corymbosa var. corymbosa]|uniref:OLC1v1024252C1 n=1 Tax=Oldenlandia corymbosa var. corymbosa TaxID=529605 RepID=A0AAV1C296_OLDCO|nr:OLC1v1024252C1 [Oldenlandia corymbosa var. corymbosa]